jgi:hypothetical protein
MEQGPSWEANRFSASQEITRNLGNPKVYYCFCKWTCRIQAPNIPSTKSHAPLSLLWLYQSISPGPRLSVWTFRNKISFNIEELLALPPIPKLEDHPLSGVRDCLFNIFAAALHIADRSSNRNLRMRHAVVTGTHLSHGHETNKFRRALATKLLRW